MNQLALYGGAKAKSVPYSTGRRFGAEELQQVAEALEQDSLFYWKGKKVRQFCEKFSKLYGTKHCVATSSGTAALHTALGAIGITEGDEVITSPITDMGTVIGILYQNAIPVFADVDPYTYNMDPQSIERNITPKTKAILVVHLAGNPADMDEIMKIAERYNLKVVEDCAQAYMTYYKKRLVGTIGHIGCFSLNDFKHITAGDGGMCIMNDELLYHKALRFADKNYSRISVNGVVDRDVPFIAPNYRMNEITGAVAIAQLDRVEWICEKRRLYGDGLTYRLRRLPGITPPLVKDGNLSSYWFYLFRVDEAELGIDTDTFIQALQAEGVPCSRGYIPTCIYEYGLFKNRSAYLNTHAPFDSPYCGQPRSYPTGLCPVAEDVLKSTVRLEVSEFFSEEDLRQTAEAIEKVSVWFANNEK